MNTSIQALILWTNAVLGVILLSSCRHVSSAPLRGIPELTVDEVFSRKDEHRRWDEVFIDAAKVPPEITKLVMEAVKSNPSLGEANARIIQAAALVKQAEAGQGMALNYDAQLTLGRQRVPVLGRDPIHEYAAGALLSYTPDLWGKLKLQVEIAHYNHVMQQENLRAAVLNIAGQISTLWLQVVYNRELIANLQRQRALNRTLAAINKRRYREAGSVPNDIILDLDRTYESLNQQILKLQSSEVLLCRQLNVLLGHSPVKPYPIVTEHLPAKIPRQMPGIPADLLVNRPDLRAVFWRLQMETARLKLTNLAWYPDLKLSLSWRYSARELADLLDTWITTLVAQLTGALYDSGLREAQYQQQVGVLRELAHLYRNTYFQAILAVETALEKAQRAAQEEASVHSQLELIQRKSDLLRTRYAHGTAAAGEILNLEISRLQLESSLLELRRQRLQAWFDLIQAAGGEWRLRPRSRRPQRARLHRAQHPGGLCGLRS
ncbi:MAG: TolC family protein, partial [Lentisphaerae bacterium]